MIQTSWTGNFNALFKMAESKQNLKESFGYGYSIFLCGRIEIYSHLQWFVTYYYTTCYIESNGIFLLCHEVAPTMHVTELLTGQ